MQGITIIIPVYNEEVLIIQNALKLVKYMDQLSVKYEIIIGSNGSTDGTIKKGKFLAKENKQIIFFHIDKKGVGDIFKRSIKKSKYPIILSLDMDLSIDLNFIKESLDLSRDYDIVIGSKSMGEQDRSFLRKIPSYVFTVMVKLLLGIRFNDYSMAAKLYKKDVIKKYSYIIDSGTSYVIGIIYLAFKGGYNIIEIPVKCFDKRKSKFNIINEIFYRFFGLLKLWLFG